MRDQFNSKMPADKVRLCLHLLGGCEVRSMGAPVHLESTKATALLVYLVMNPGPQRRHKLLGLLGGNFPEHKARRNLRHALWNIKRQLLVSGEPNPIVANRETLAFNQQIGYWLDVEAFQIACSQVVPYCLWKGPENDLDIEKLRNGVDLYRGDFLDGFFVNGVSKMEEWALVVRERVRTTAWFAVQSLAAYYTNLNDLRSALYDARWMLALDPWREEAHRLVMVLCAIAGLRSEALVQYATCCRILAQEFGVQPSVETKAVYEQIKGRADLSPFFDYEIVAMIRKG